MDEMSNRSKRKPSMGFVTAVVLIAIAYACRLPYIFGWDPPENFLFAERLLRDLIFICVPLGWVISVRRRVIQVQVRRYLTAVGVLIVLWILLRTVKYHVHSSFELQSLLWYLYYFPILFIPTMCLFAFRSMGKPEGFRLSRRFHMILIIPTILFLLIITNNFTQWAFVFLTNPPIVANFLYSRSFVYYASMVWVGLVTIAALAVLIRKSRLLTMRQAGAIMAVLAIMVLYLVMYAFPGTWQLMMALNLRDISVIVCLFIMAILELCLKFRIIQNNTNYAELFARIDTPAAILDETGNICFVSKRMPEASNVQLWQAQSRPLELEGGLLVESMPIRNGSIVWTEDISQIKAIQSEIKAASEQLTGENDMLRAEVELKEKMAAAEMRNNLYDEVVKEVSPEIERLDRLAESRGETLQERTMVLKRLCVIGTYIKRRCNLIFLAAEHDGKIPVEELYYCLRESSDALKLMDVECSVSLKTQGSFDAEEVKGAYDLFEQKLEALDRLPRTISITIDSVQDSVQLDITTTEVSS